MNTIGTHRRSVRRRVALAAVGLTAMTVATGLSLAAPASAQVTGTVVLYADINYGGVSFGYGPGTYSNIGSTWNDRASSIRVPAGTVVSVYEDGGFGGRCETFRGNDADLRDNPIGNDTITALKVGQPCPARLLDDPNYGGSWINIYGDIPDLGTYGFSDRAESLHVAPWSKVALYDQPNYQGLCELFTADDPNFVDNPIRQRASSLRVNADCPKQGVLFENINYDGDYLIVTGSVDTNWAEYWDWKDRASSVHVTACTRLYLENNYQEDVVVIGVLLRWFKVYETVTVDDPDLRNNVVGNDGVDHANISTSC